MSVNSGSLVSELLQLDALLAMARQKSGLTDFVDEGFIEPLTHLLAAYRSEAHLSEQGVRAMQAHLIDALVTRLKLYNTVKLHPEILEERIKGPLVILGMPRTGTTKLHRLLASSPEVQKLPLWKILNPIPIAPVDDTGTDPRVALAEQFVEGLKQAFPRFYAGHPMIATEPDEEDFLMELSFKGSPAYWMARIPGYQAWTRGQSIESSYRWLRMILQIVQWHDAPEARKHKWLLKAPSHIGRLDDLFSVFPDATIIHCHRAPLTVVPSAAAIAEALRHFYSDRVDKMEAGRFAIELLHDELNNYLQARKRWEDAGKIFVDVQFSDIVEDVAAVVEHIFSKVGIPFPAETKNAIARWEIENPQHKHGHFDYRLDEYGLTAAEVQERFAAYSARFLAARASR